MLWEQRVLYDNTCLRDEISEQRYFQITLDDQSRNILIYLTNLEILISISQCNEAFFQK